MLTQIHLGYILERIYPTASFIRSGEEAPIQTKIVDRNSCLDWTFLRDSYFPSAFAELNLGGVEHFACNVLKPYSEVFHILTLRVDKQWAPSPHFYSPEAGRGVCLVGGVALDYAQQFGRIACWGYNVSPYYYLKDGFFCFASMPSLWHPQVWIMGEIPTYIEAATKYARWTQISSLTPVQRRALVDNNFGIPFAKALLERLEDAPFARHWPLTIHRRESYFTPRGLTLQLEGSIIDMLQDPMFFEIFLQPLDTLILELMKTIYDSLFVMEYEEREKIMIASRDGLPKKEAMDFLTSVPKIHKLAEAAQGFEEAGIDDRLLTAIWSYAKNLNEVKGPVTDRLIQGPAYSVVFVEEIGSRRPELTIMPGFPQGNGGVVEALGILLSRPTDYSFSLEEIKERSARLYVLGDELRRLADL